MQNKGAVRLLAILLALICIFYLSFSVITRIHEKRADTFAHRPAIDQLADNLSKGDELKRKVIYDSLVQRNRKFYLDSISTEEVYKLYIRNYTYLECKEREINLGLDLQGGMNVTLEVSVVDVVRSMAGNTKDSLFNLAIKNTIVRQAQSEGDFVDLFYKSYKEVDPTGDLAAIFSFELSDRIQPGATDQEVLDVLHEETGSAIDRTYNILKTRIDQFGVAQPNIQQLSQRGRILVELPGIKEPDRVKELLERTAKLEFWETWKFSEIWDDFEKINKNLRDVQFSAKELLLKEKSSGDLPDADGADTSQSLLSGIVTADDTLQQESSLLDIGEEGEDAVSEPLSEGDQYARENPLWRYLTPNIIEEGGQQRIPESPVVGSSRVKDTMFVNLLLKEAERRGLIKPQYFFKWTVKPSKYKNYTEEKILDLVALKDPRGDRIAPLDGSAVSNASQNVDQNGRVIVNMLMNTDGTRKWANLTRDNVGREVAIVLDNYVYSFPTVNEEIANGSSQISGDFSIKEAQDLANVLKAGKLPAPARIVQDEVVGPSLGREAIRSGLMSFVIAFLLVLFYMIFYYRKAGIIADFALLANVFFLLGVLASIQATLTLPGIAGIVLTLGMAVDANVITFERIKEEIRFGKGVRLAIHDGFKNALSAIIDGNVTTLLTGIVLAIFGTGPVKGFATTLIIGILTSLFSAVLLSRLIFVHLLDKNKKITFGSKLTINAFSKINFDFIKVRKKFYIISLAVIGIGIISLAFNGLNYGVDFSGGRTYVVRFDNNVETTKISKALEEQFGSAPEVKTFGPSSQVKITTKYLIEDNTRASDSIVDHMIYEGVKGFYRTPVNFEQFNTDSDEQIYGKMSSQKVGPTIADDIKRASVFAITFALIIIFLYIALRFRKWQYGLGGLTALFHDSLIVISLFSIFYTIMPFSMEIDQAFIAAILTIIGYSVNDSVVIFDRIREFVSIHPKTSIKDNINNALNSTLGRTFNTSGTTFLVLFSIFIFGGEVIRGFSFALMVGILVGTYSSLFVASPIAFDFIQRQQAKRDRKAAALGKRKRK